MWQRQGDRSGKESMNTNCQSQKPKETRITPVSKHFTEKGHSVRDMQFSLLEWCSLKYNTPKSEHRKMREKWWMWNIGAIHPIGINQFI